jgi:hypothetical protein
MMGAGAAVRGANGKVYTFAVSVSELVEQRYEDARKSIRMQRERYASNFLLSIFSFYPSLLFATQNAFWQRVKSSG